MTLTFDRLYDGAVDTLPLIEEGAVYFLTADQRLYAATNGNWTSFGVPFGLVLVERRTGVIVQYNGTTFTPVLQDMDCVNYQPQIDSLVEQINNPNIPENITIAATTIEQLKGLSPTKYLGHKVFLDCGGGKGDFVLRQGATPVEDPNQCVYVVSNTLGYYWERVCDGPVNFLWCGGDRNYTANTDNWVAWIQAIKFCGATGRPLYIPTGRYGFKNAPQIMMTDFYASGILIYGDGQARTILDLRSVTSSPNIMIHSASDFYYPTLRDIGIIGNIQGYVMQIGKSDMSDPPNMVRFQNVSIQNFNQSGESKALLMNYCVGGDFDIQLNCGSGGSNGAGGYGIALTMRGCGFNKFFGSIGSASISILMQDVVNFGNQFNCLDMENVAICVRMVGPAHKSNTFISGQWSYFVAGIDCQNSVKTKVINPNLWPGAPATEANFVAASVGLTVS